MKLYEIKNPGDIPIALVDVSEIALGSSGRGRKLITVPVVGDGHSYRAIMTPEGVVLMRGDWEDENRCLCVINTQGVYDRYRSYGIFDASGVTIIAEGYHAFGEAGNLGTQPHILAIVNDGAEFRLHSKYSAHWYRYHNSEWSVESPSERAARLAVEAVARGEGEWL